MSLSDSRKTPGSPPPMSSPSIAPTALSGMTHWTQMPPMPNPDQVRDVLATMRQTLENLGVTFDTLDKHSAKVANIDFEYDYEAQITSLRKHMKISEKKQENRMEELKTLLKDVLKDEIVPHVRSKVDEQINVEFNSSLNQHITNELERLIPVRLQQQVVDDSHQLGEVHIHLHNSEARRANALIRSNHLSDPLHPLLTPDGVVSSNFPRDLSQLFSLDDDTAMALNGEYGMMDVMGGKERNLNRFMQFCGISYQMSFFIVPLVLQSCALTLRVFSSIRLSQLRQTATGALELRSDSLPTAVRMFHLMFAEDSDSEIDGNPSSATGGSNTGSEDEEMTGSERATTEAAGSPRAATPDNFGLTFLGGVMAAATPLAALYLAGRGAVS